MSAADRRTARRATERRAAERRAADRRDAAPASRVATSRTTAGSAALGARLEALHELREMTEGRVDGATTQRIDEVLEHTGQRRSLSSAHTVVGFLGATGSGKSSLLNAVVGEELARAHVRRPTTSEPLAAIWNPQGAEPLLDWLQVRDRRLVADPFAGDSALSLILLDLPDFDSVQPEHRAIAERLAGQVDVLVWVVDPQKYADAVLHGDFVQPLSAHGAVTLVVLNQTDLLAPDQVPAVADSLHGLLRADGLEGAEVIPASARTGEGIEQVRSRIARIAHRSAAAQARLTADLQVLGDELSAQIDAPGRDDSARARRAQRAELSERLADAAGAEEVATAVGRSYARRTGQVTGWPLTSWLLRLRADPLRRLHLLPSTAQADRRDGRDPELHRTALPPLTAGQSAQMGLAVREHADRRAAELPPAWQASVRRRAERSVQALPTELDRAIARTDLGARGSWWWPVIAVVQWIALAAALVGVLWYLAAWLLPLWSLPGPEISMVEGWPVPMLLIGAGVLLGILLGLASQALGTAIGAGRRRRARRRLLRSVDEVVEREVIVPLQQERESAQRAAELLGRVRAR